MKVLINLGLPALLLAATGTVAAVETALPLNGTWQLQRASTAQAPDPNGRWQDVTVPSHLEQATEPFAWCRRSFTLPQSAAGRHVFLSFGGVKFACDVYVNGQRVGGHYGGWEPFEIEITQACRAGQPDELLVRVQDVRGVIDGAVSYAPGRNLVEAVRGRVLAPVGSQTALFGIWQDVSLVLREDAFVDDVTVTTSVRQKRMDAKYAVRNLSDKPLTVTLSGQVKDGAQTALDMGKADLTVPPRSAAEVTLSRPWADSTLWSPDSPHLYSLDSQLSEKGRQLDARRTRFGFREFWTDGVYLVLNGARIKFLATAGHPPGDGRLLSNDQIRAKYEAIRSANCMAMRLHANIWPENWYDVADEIGLPLIQESAIWCFAQNYALEKKEFWANAREHWQSVIRRDKNHPSIVMYSIENEMLDVGGDRVAETQKSLGDLGRFVKSLDPTRPIMYDGDEDPDGAADVINLHYPHEFPGNTLYPDTCYWLEAKAKVAGWPRREWEWSRNKPLYIGEFLWVPATDAQGMTLFMGDDAYRDFGGSRFRSKAIAWEMQIQAYRAAEVAGMCPWTIWESGEFPNQQSEAVKRAYEPNAAFVREYDRRFYAGEAVQRTIFLYNDTLKAADLTLQWSLDGRLQGEKKFSMQAAERISTTAALAMPAADKVTPVQFEVAVKNGDRPVYRAVRTYIVYPRVDPKFRAAPGARVAVYGADAAFLDMLRRGGVEPVALGDLGNIAQPGVQTLIVAAHALDGLAGQDETPIVGGGTHEAIGQFVEGGGTVLVLEQNKYPADMLPASLSDRAATIAFKRSEAGGVLSGIEDDGLKFWRGDDLVGRRILSRPRDGGFRVFVDTGGPSGLDGVLLMEVLQGKGCYVLSQLLIAEKLGREPVAQAMLENLVGYALTPQPSRRPIGLVRGAAKLDEDLRAVGAEFDDLTGRLSAADLSKYSALLLDGSAEEVLAAQERLKDFALHGGKAVLHGVTDDALARLSKSVAAGLTVQANYHVPVLVNAREDEVTDGLTNEDVYWIGKPGDWRTLSTLATDVLHGEVTRHMPPLADCTVMEAQTMRLPDGERGAAVRNGELAMWMNASAEARIVLPRKGEYFFGVVGRGTPVAGTFPDVAVNLDGKPLGNLQVANREPAPFAIIGQAEAGPHVLRLSFDNDAYDPQKGEDRNLWLDKFFFAESHPGPEKALLRPGGLLKLEEGKGLWLIDQVAWDGKVSSSDQAARYLCGLLANLGVSFTGGHGATVISAARMEPGRADNFRREGTVAYIGSNNAVSIDVRFVRDGRYRFTVNAKGTPALGQYPAVRLLLDGKAVGDGQLQRGGWQNLSFAADVTAGVHKLAVEFTNDLWVRETGEDRNLWVRQVSIGR